MFGGGGGAALGGYSNTNEGKVIAASFLDNWNNIVRAVRNNPSLIQAKAGPAAQANAANSVKAGAASCRRCDDGQDRRGQGAQGPGRRRRRR